MRWHCGTIQVCQKAQRMKQIQIKQHKQSREAQKININNNVAHNKHRHIPSWGYMVRVASKI